MGDGPSPAAAAADEAALIGSALAMVRNDEGRTPGRSDSRDCPTDMLSLASIEHFTEDDDGEVPRSPRSQLLYMHTFQSLLSLVQDSGLPNQNFSFRLQHSSPSSPQGEPAQAGSWSSHQMRRVLSNSGGRNPLLERLRLTVPMPLPRPWRLPSNSHDGRLLQNMAAMKQTASDPSQANGDANVKRAKVRRPRRESRGVRETPEGDDLYVDFSRLLKSCANYLGINDREAAFDALQKVMHHASPSGNGGQRSAYYFSEALQARLRGTGWGLYMGQLRPQGASLEEIYDANDMYMMDAPIAKASLEFVLQIILHFARKARVLHIMEYQFTGHLYPHLFEALAKRIGGPPEVRLIAGKAPHYSYLAQDQRDFLSHKMKEKERHLKRCAELHGIPFHFTPWVGNTGEFRMRDYVNPDRGPEEILVILSTNPLRYINEDLLSPPQRRQGILENVCFLNPDAFIRGSVTASYSTPYFTTRFDKTFFFFECQYEMLDTFVKRNDRRRHVFERENLGRAVLNLVACEEKNDVKKAETYQQCQASMVRVGLQQMPLKKTSTEKVRARLKEFSMDFHVEEDKNYLLMGWKGRTLHALSVWLGRTF